MIVIGDSFWWTIAVQIPLGEIFSQVPYWYYNSTIYYDERYNSVDELDLAEELLSADFVVLFYCATQQYRMNDGFPKKALEALNSMSDEATLDTTAFIEREIQCTIADILASPAWMEIIRKKAEDRGVSVEQALHDDAEWVVNQKIETGTMNWPEKKRKTNTKSEDHGIQ